MSLNIDDKSVTGITSTNISMISLDPMNNENDKDSEDHTRIVCTEQTTEINNAREKNKKSRTREILDHIKYNRRYKIPVILAAMTAVGVPAGYAGHKIAEVQTGMYPESVRKMGFTGPLYFTGLMAAGPIAVLQYDAYIGLAPLLAVSGLGVSVPSIGFSLVGHHGNLSDPHEFENSFREGMIKSDTVGTVLSASSLTGLAMDYLIRKV